MLEIFDASMNDLYGQIDLRQVEDPRFWEEMSKIALIVDDYVQIKAIFATIGLNTDQTHNDNVRKGFD